MTPQEIADIISSVHLGYSTEAVLQTELNDLLISRGVKFIREHRLNARDRVDFFAQPGVAIECKVDSSPATVVRQLARYAESPDVLAIILVTSKRMHTAAAAFGEQQLLGKPLFGVWIGGMK